MIITRLMGGLGNQMFQHAAGRALAERLGTELRIDRSWFASSNQGDAPREYELNCFRLPQKFIEPSDYILLEDGPKSLKRHVYLRTKAITKPKISAYKEPHYHFDPSAAKLGNNTLIEGYWQSEQYFRDHKDAIRKDFTFIHHPLAKNAELAKQIQECNSVSLHVRRSDYVTNKNFNKFHGLMGLDYYKAAVKIIEKQVKNPVFFIISDDPAWCKENIKIAKHTTVYIDHNKVGWKDMQLMSLCKHHIIANSSFSWWGAWLQPEEKEHLVIAPKVWFADDSVNTKDVTPSRWERI